MRLGGTRREALNEALHELRRPLQSLTLAIGPGQAGPGAIESSLFLATAALDRLDEEINGGERRRRFEPVSARGLVEAGLRRWRPRAGLAGVTLSASTVEPVILAGDPIGLAQALDNLIVNAIEHGGSPVTIGVRRWGGRVRIEVADAGGERSRRPRPTSPVEMLERLTGRVRRGHGLTVVRRVAAEHGGRFQLGATEGGTVATVELPLRRPSAA
jgi:signal transduction histidine kinase